MNPNFGPGFAALNVALDACFVRDVIEGTYTIRMQTLVAIGETATIGRA